MQAIPNRPSRALQIAATLFPFVAFPTIARADIFQWEYINPADPSQGKQQSTTLAPDGAGVDAVPGANLSWRNLTMAYLVGADLTGANFDIATLTDADFTGAVVQGASFSRNCCGYDYYGTGISAAQLYSTASYQARDLIGIDLSINNLAGGNFAGQNLTNATFYGANLTSADLHQANLTNANFYFATLTGADFTGAEVRGATLGGISAAQLYSTASYEVRDLTAIQLYGDLSGWSFADQNLTNAIFLSATLTGADFTGAEVRGANFGKIRGIRGGVIGTGLALPQLYSTASYQAGDLSGINFGLNDLTGGNFAALDLKNANFAEANVRGANFRDANLANASFNDFNCGPFDCYGGSAVLTDADFTGTEVRGTNFGGTGFTLAQLYSTASYQAHDLSGIDLESSNLTGGNFAGQNLTNASFYYATLTAADFTAATLTGADFTGAEIRGAIFDKARYCKEGGCDPAGSGLTLTQIYSTASYQAHDLRGVGLAGSDLAGAMLAGQNLSNATFVAPFRVMAILTGANLTAADMRGAVLDLRNQPDLITANLILPDGHIDGLQLNAGGLLVVHDYDGDPSDFFGNPVPPIPITVDQHLTMGPGGTLRIVFEADAWDSTISFAPGIPVALGGTLELTFAADVDITGQIGRTFDLFDWTGVNPTGAFAISSPYVWDLSNLYTTGQATLTAIAEPGTATLLVAGLAGPLGWLGVRRRRRW
jgi:uncharacterized protein YjbI with pentapeptide repeats